MRFLRLVFGAILFAGGISMMQAADARRPPPSKLGAVVATVEGRPYVSEGEYYQAQIFGIILTIVGASAVLVTLASMLRRATEPSRPAGPAPVDETLAFHVGEAWGRLRSRKRK
jgi:hypothetical protein